MANMATFISYWDTPGSPAEEDTQSGADVGRAMVSGAEEPKTDQLAPVDPAGDTVDEEVTVVEVTKVGAGRGSACGRRGGGGRRRGRAAGPGRGASLPPDTEESEEEAAQRRRKYTEEEERVLLDIMGLREFRARFGNRTEKKDKVWVAVAEAFNEEMRRRNPQYIRRNVLHLRQKWDNQLRSARKHNLFVLKNNGTNGGSGNGRDVLDDVKAPPYYEELLEAGWLEGPLSNPIHIINGGTKAADFNDLEGEDLADHAASWAGDELPESQEPYGGSVESRALADRKKDSRESSGNKGGRPSKMGQLLKASNESAGMLADASLEGGKRLAEAITAAVQLQMEEAREVRKEEERRRKEEARMRREQWDEEKAENHKHRAAMVECIGMLARALTNLGQGAAGGGSM